MGSRCQTEGGRLPRFDKFDIAEAAKTTLALGICVRLAPAPGAHRQVDARDTTGMGPYLLHHGGKMH